jgi:hypothetical protein
MRMEITSDAEKVLARFARLSPAMQTGIKRRLKGALLLTETAVIQGAKLKWRRGAAGLQGRLTSYVTGGGSSGIARDEHGRFLTGVKADDSFALDAAIGFRKTRGFPYELSQEFGAKAKPGKAIAIPLTKEAAQHKSPREMGGLVMIKRLGKAPLLVEERGTKVIAHWVLVKRLLPRLHFRASVIRALPMISDAIERGAQEGVATV